MFLTKKLVFEDMINNKDVGSYNCCEIIEIFGFNKTKNNCYNIYAIVVFENSNIQIDEEEYLTEKLIKIDKDNSVGIKKMRVKISEIIPFFTNLKNNIYTLKNKELNIGNMAYFEKIFIEKTESSSHPINYIIKNNFDNGSYIFEFFDSSKNNVKYLLEDSRKLNRLSEEISKIIPIKIGPVSDRLGNVVFQFPITSLNVELKNKKEVELIFHGEDKVLEGLQIIAKSVYDNIIFDSTQTNLLKGEKSKILDINIKDTYELELEIFKGNLLLYKNNIYYMKKILFDINIGNSQKRFFKINESEYSLDINITSPGNSSLNERKEECFNYMNERKFENELNELKKNKSFLQYKTKENEKALNDIRILINIYGKNGVYLWDPYANAVDIKNTLYFNKISNAKMRVITNLDRQKANETKIELEKDEKEYLLMELEVRNKTGNKGYSFHDRFLIFPLEKPKVWSLGISINQVGKSHHILQEVSQPQHIVNSFNELWESLNVEECLLWKI